MNKSIVFAAIFGATCAYAEPPRDDASSAEMRDRVQSAMDAAYAQAKSQQRNGPLLQGNSPLSPHQLRKVQSADPSAVAARFKGKLMRPEEPNDQLLIFVSTGMPAKALKRLGEQAKTTGAVLVFRGLRMPLGQPGAMEDMANAIAPVAKTGADLQINPEAFARYRVEAVPTFVLTAKEEGCSAEQCPAKAYALAGDVTLEYALETWSERGGAAGKMADHYLVKLEKNKNGG